MALMFIRKTQTNNTLTGEKYFTFRLVRGQRIANKVRQITVLNLGRHFPIPQEDWPLLCARIEQLLAPQAAFAPIACSEIIEHAAQRYFAQLVGRSVKDKSASALSAQNPEASVNSPNSGAAVPALPSASVAAPSPSDSSAVPSASVSAVSGSASASAPDFQSVDIDTMEDSDSRTVSVEHVALHAIAQLGLVQTMTQLGINSVKQAAILGNIIGRMAEPRSELATWDWLCTHSALGELLDVDYEGLSHMSLYRASDLLMKHRQAIEDSIFRKVTTLFSLQETVTLYDLTNTYFEGQAGQNAKAQHGHSKEKRSDCPLVTLGLVLDGSGFVRRSKTFDGNVNEAKTLEGNRLDPPCHLS